MDDISSFYDNYLIAVDPKNPPLCSSWNENKTNPPSLHQLQLVNSLQAKYTQNLTQFTPNLLDNRSISISFQKKWDTFIFDNLIKSNKNMDVGQEIFSPVKGKSAPTSCEKPKNGAIMSW